METTIVITVWLFIVGLLGGGRLATAGKIKVTDAKHAPIARTYLRPCISAGEQNCDK